jgi:hypothetical protein
MTTSRLTARLDKVLLQLDPLKRRMVVFVEDGESDMDVVLRTAVTWPVVMAPKPCATAEEWLRQRDVKRGAP